MVLDYSVVEIRRKTAFHLPEEDVIRKCETVGVYTGYIASCVWNKELYNMEQELYRLLRLRRFSDTCLEAACHRAAFYNCCSFDMVYMILSHGLYLLPLDKDIDVFGQKFFNFVDGG
jgi:hypothetical protein